MNCRNRRLLKIAMLAALSHGPPDRMRNALWGQYCLGISAIAMLKDALGKNAKAGFTSPLAYLQRRLENRRYSDADFLRWLDFRDEYLRALELPGVERVPRVNELDQRIRAMPRPLLRIVGTPEWGHPVKVDAEIEAQVRATRTALGVERYRLGHFGALPDRLEDLVPNILPALLLDPFTDDTLRYKRRPVGYVIYSVGSDGLDNDGREKVEGDADSIDYDITFTIGR